MPDLDVSLRGAVSIARRLQDPLAELVKIDPKSIGVGQYQHDVGQIKLARSLDAVVEDCVNAVGVDVNTASVPLLARVSGLNASAGRKHRRLPRRQRRLRSSRDELKKVPRLGDKTFEQAAGFLRIMNGDNPLDASAVHPEAYPVVRKDPRRHEARPIKDVIGDSAPAESAESVEIHRRELRPADRHRHPQGTGKTRPRPAPRVQDRDLHGGVEKIWPT